MRPHLRYLRYVLMHKLYVFIGGIAVKRMYGDSPWGWVCWLWRLLVHDLSKFRPSEWNPYVAFFYGEKPEDVIRRKAVKWRTIGESHGAFTEAMESGHLAACSQALTDLKKKRKAQFDRAWLFHQHRNPHHWQHWLLHEDSGKNFVLTPEAWIIDEMVADWIGAGQKILSWPTLTECIAATVQWYVQNASVIQIRQISRERVEETLRALAKHYGLVDLAFQQRAHLQMAASAPRSHG